MEEETIPEGKTISSLPATEDLGDEFISELNKLSIQERDGAIYDLHGVSSISEEDPELIRIALDSFEIELNSIPDREKQAYLLAREQSLEHVTNEKFLLMFLRGNHFDSKLAAARFVGFFKFKMELFGKDKLGRDIRVNDLNEEDMVCLESGFAQILSTRDRADRAVFFLVPMGGKYDDNGSYVSTLSVVSIYRTQ